MTRKLIPWRSECCRKLLIAAGSFVFVAGSALGQANAPASDAAPPAAQAETKPIEYDTVSIKPNKNGNDNITIRFTPDGFRATNVPLKEILQFAYGVKLDLISGEPGWVDSDHFDIEARMAGPDAEEFKKLDNDHRSAAQKHMIQAFLADRFQMKAHIDPKQLPVYELLLAKGGSKLKQSTPGDTYPNGVKGPDGVAHGGMMMMNNSGTTQELTGQGIPLFSLVAMLSRQLHRTVIDKTGLTGNFEIALKWAADDNSAAMSAGPGNADSSSDASSPSIFAALQEQLGLKLQSAKGPVDTLVIDHIEKPSEN